MPVTTEIERKYDVDDRTRQPELGSLGELEISAPVVLEAVYYDTADARLGSRRIALRRRAGGGDEGWHVKLPAVEGRTELQFPLSDEPPRELHDAVAAIVRGRPLVELARIRTSRTVTTVAIDGRPVAEFADDEVQATDAASGTLRIWREWEVELVDGAAPTAAERRELLDRIEERLLASGARPATSVAKIARALGRDALGTEPAVPEPNRESTALEVVRAVLRSLVDDLVALDGSTRRHEPDALHQLRIRIRRLRSVLAADRGVIDRAVTDPIRARLGELGGVLGAARDAEVRRQTVLDALAAHLDETAPHALGIREWLDGDLAERGRSALGRADAALAGEAYWALLDDLDELIARPPVADRALRPARDQLKAALRKEGRRAVRRGREARVDDLDSQHEARKAARRLRYAAESVTRTVPLFGKRTLAVADAARSVQDVLGEARDLAVLADELEAAGGAPAHLAPLVRRDAEDVARRHARAAAKLEKAVRKL